MILNNSDIKNIIQEIIENIKKFYVQKEDSNKIIKVLKDKKFSQEQHLFVNEITKYLKKFDGHFSLNVIEQNKKNISKKFIESNTFKNIGYIKILKFPGFNNGIIDQSTGHKIARTMKKIHETKKLIIDLRDNPGGCVHTADLFISYFFNIMMPLYNVYNRDNIIKRTAKTYPYIEGPKYLDKPIYILINNNTASSAELVTYILKNNLINIKIIGKKSKGMANPILNKHIYNNYNFNIPNTYFIDSKKNSNWEKKGINPDIKMDLPIDYKDIINYILSHI